jgi:hypothetical protein
MEESPRVVFDGPAGTGKTLLAIETARRAVLKHKRTLLVCFNRMLGEWLRTETASLGPLLVCRTLHGYMLDVSGARVPDDADAQFWEAELPDLAVGGLLERASGEVPPFAVLIVDEAQDLLRMNYLDALDLSLAGGIEGGVWRFFSDTTRQAIYQSANVPLNTFLSQRSGGAVKYQLNVNCRNTPRVATLVSLLGGLVPPYSRVRRPDDGIEPVLHFYRTVEEQQRLLYQVLDMLFGEKYAGEDVVVLSPLAAQSCASQVRDRPWVDRLRELGNARHGFVGYGSIYAFKGLEAACVVVTDIEHLDSDDVERLFYTAITRTTERLIIFMHERVRSNALALVRRAATV